MGLEQHPSVVRYRERIAAEPEAARGPLNRGEVRNLALECGADDAGLVELDRDVLADQRADSVRVFPAARSYLSIVCRLNPDNIRSVSRGAADGEFHRGMAAVNEVAHRIASALRRRGVRAMTPPSGFPMDLGRWPEQMWAVSHKPIAAAAGLGVMGHHRLLVHPRFGSFVVLGTVLLDRDVTEPDAPLDYDPCLECKLCVAVCPVGAVAKDGHFSFGNCLAHNYRDRLGGFVDWAESLADSRNARQYRRKVSDAETVSMWQSLSYGVCNKSSYCMAVCPAGDEIVGQYVDDKKGFLRDVVKPLQAREEQVYVLRGSDAEAHVRKRFPHKPVKLIGMGLRPRTIAGFLQSMPLVFQRGAAADLELRYHLVFHGEEQLEATVVIDHGRLEVLDGLEGQPDLTVRADSRTWLEFLGKDRGIAGALLTGKVRIKGPPALMKPFARCFPG